MIIKGRTNITKTLIVVMICRVALTLARPQPPPNFILWNYFPFIHQQHLQMMQQPNIPSMPPVNIQQYPTFELFFNGPIPINSNMPIIGEVQFQVAVPPKTTQKPITTTTATTTRRTTRRQRPRLITTRTTSTTTTTTTSPPPLPLLAPAPAWPTKRRTLFKQSTPSVTDDLKFQLSKSIFEMARNIQAHILSKDNHQPSTGKFNVFSPINIAAVLSLLELGAKGQTSQELQRILGFHELKPSERSLNRHYVLGQMLESVLHPETTATMGGAYINMANGIFMQTGYSMKPDYRTSVETIYQSQVTALDFQRQPAVATKFINNWVRQQTNGKIVNIVADDGIDRSTRMMVASAVYFKALWASSFIPVATTMRPFYPNSKDGQKIMVETMGNGGEFKYYESKDYDCGIMAFPYKGHTTTMYVILPNKSNAERLRQLQATLTAEIIEEMISKMEMRTALITMPKMHLTDTLNLKDVLSQLELRNVFEGDSSDFSGISEHNQISLDELIHKIDLTINETGTEAAAATASSLSRQEFDVEFRVDSPFMFFVRHDETKLPIFYGSVIEPTDGA